MLLYNHQEEHKNKKPVPQSLDSEHGTGTNQKKKGAMIIT